MPESNIIYVGSKPVMNYVLAAITIFHGNIKEVLIKARGRAISRSVDVAEIIKNKFLTDIKVKSITTGTEMLRTEDGNEFNTSTIEIILERGGD
ncbi:DNA-binding protein Alba [Candidatus Borrarchaeum sp.]|jgi:DNA-binding protein|uniref:DNA-binding protein Alba n=1 Tax=Candidatus Borrarchaeum sp. TaxID=2846742 RepID=UPI002580DDBF|nr:DNA-binding protein Alba [Candidatus Borrarchaeum sp.]